MYLILKNELCIVFMVKHQQINLLAYNDINISYTTINI